MQKTTVTLSVLLMAASVLAQTPQCDRLDRGSKKLAMKILDSEYAYECCDETISKCLDVKAPSRLVRRLADNVCRRVAQGQDEVRIRRALSRRARSMLGDGVVAEIDLTSAPSTGPSEAPVVVVVYACARCPYCSRLVPALVEEVSEGGALEGKVRLVFRIFPIKGHEGSTAAGLAFAAADEMDAFWPYLLTAYGHFDDFDPQSPELLGEWAVRSGLDGGEFEARLTDPALRERIVRSKKEGLRNGVEETPTLFINGRRWVGDLEIVEVVDALGEEVERCEEVLCDGSR